MLCYCGGLWVFLSVSQSPPPPPLHSLRPSPHSLVSCRQQRVSSIHLAALRDVSTIDGASLPQYVWMDNNNYNSSNSINTMINVNNGSTQVVQPYNDVDDDVSDTLSSDDDDVDQGPGLGPRQWLGQGQGQGQGQLRGASVRGTGDISDGRFRPSPINTTDRGPGLGPGIAQGQGLGRRPAIGGGVGIAGLSEDRGGGSGGRQSVDHPHPVIDSNRDIRDNRDLDDNRDNRLGWAQFERLAHLGLPGSLSQFVELGCFELMACIAAQLGPVPLGKWPWPVQ